MFRHGINPSGNASILFNDPSTVFLLIYIPFNHHFTDFLRSMVFTQAYRLPSLHKPKQIISTARTIIYLQFYAVVYIFLIKTVYRTHISQIWISPPCLPHVRHVPDSSLLPVADDGLFQDNLVLKNLFLFVLGHQVFDQCQQVLVLAVFINHCFQTADCLTDLSEFCSFHQSLLPGCRLTG